MLKSENSNTQSPLIFKNNKTNKHYNRSTPNDWLTYFFNKYHVELQKKGLHKISPHGFRHSQATLLYELDINPKDAQNRLRHKNIKTTLDIYTHISENRKQELVNRLNDFSDKGTMKGPTL